MADKSTRYPENVPGRFYVDENCADCNACNQTAPDNFKRDEAGGFSYVWRQPESDEELELCVEALEACCTSCIGDDGDV